MPALLSVRDAWTTRASTADVNRVLQAAAAAPDVALLATKSRVAEDIPENLIRA